MHRLLLRGRRLFEEEASLDKPTVFAGLDG